MPITNAPLSAYIFIPPPTGDSRVNNPQNVSAGGIGTALTRAGNGTASFCKTAATAFLAVATILSIFALSKSLIDVTVRNVGLPLHSTNFKMMALYGKVMAVGTGIGAMGGGSAALFAGCITKLNPSIHRADAANRCNLLFWITAFGLVSGALLGLIYAYEIEDSVLKKTVIKNIKF